MNKTFRLILTIVLSSLCIPGNGQRLRADMNFDGLFDNREYKNDMLPQTIYGMRIMPEVSIDYPTDNCNHTMTAGLSKIWEFGADENIDPGIILFYKYGGERWITYFGNIPRKNLQRQLPDSFLYDSIAFFEPTIGGTLIQYYDWNWQTELYCNWFSRQTDTRREAFRIVWDGYGHAGVLGAGWFAAMTHYAKPKESGHFIYEKFQLNPYLSLDLTGVIAPQFVLKADAGVLCSLIRCRKDEAWLNPTGFLGSIQAGWKMFDVKSTVYTGDSQQPYMDDSEAGLTFHRSDPFYNHTFYNKTELGVIFISDKNVQLGFRWNLHFTPDTPVHNQQLITVKCRLGLKRQFKSQR